MKKIFSIFSTIAVFFFLILINSYGAALQNLYSQKPYEEISKNLYTHLEESYKKSLKPFSPADCLGEVVKIVVDKPKNKMFLYDTADCLVKEYDVRLGVNYGQKHFEGDKKTPEGTYVIQNKYFSGKYEKFLSISYPTFAQIKYAQSKGLSAGGEIGIHFFASEKKRGSMGCITVKTKEEINEIYDLVNIGTKIIILPDKQK